MDDSSALCSVKNDAVAAEVDETQSHVQPLIVKLEPDGVRCIIYAILLQYMAALDTFTARCYTCVVYGVIVCLSVPLSILSVTSQYCTKQLNVGSFKQRSAMRKILTKFQCVIQADVPNT